MIDMDGDIPRSGETTVRVQASKRSLWLGQEVSIKESFWPSWVLQVDAPRRDYRAVYVMNFPRHGCLPPSRGHRHHTTITYHVAVGCW